MANVHPLLPFPRVKVAADPGFRHSIQIRVWNVLSGIGDLARSGEPLHNAGILEAERSEKIGKT
jgi:hypothetical protein